MANSKKIQPDEENLEEQPDMEEISDKARETFSFSDRLDGIKHRKGRIAVFTDMEAVDNYRELDGKVQSLVDAAGNIDLKSPDGPARHKILMDEHEKLESQLEDAKAIMLKGAMTIYFHAWPNAALKVAKRDARKRFKDPILGRIPDDQAEEAGIFVDLRLLGESIVKIVDSNGATDFLEPYTVGTGKKKKIVNPRHSIGQKLDDKLPPSQWERVYNAYQILTLTDQISTMATDDPGF